MQVVPARGARATRPVFAQWQDPGDARVGKHFLLASGVLTYIRLFQLGPNLDFFSFRVSCELFDLPREFWHY